jgi:hypothetical protein
MDGARNPCLIVKLLEYLHEQGVRSTSDKARTRVVSQFRKIHYSEPYTAFDYLFSDSVFGFFRWGVHG